MHKRLQRLLFPLIFLLPQAAHAVTEGPVVDAAALKCASYSGQTIAYYTSMVSGSPAPVPSVLYPVGPGNTRIKLVIPPGVSVVGAGASSGNMANVYTGVSYDDDPPPLASQQGYGVFNPPPYLGSGADPVNHQERWASTWFVNRDGRAAYITSFSISYVIGDVAEFNNWWKASTGVACGSSTSGTGTTGGTTGGTGSGTSTGTTTSALTLTPSGATTVVPGASFSISANLTLERCSATFGGAFGTPFSVTVSGKQASGTMPNSTGSAQVTCTATTGETASLAYTLSQSGSTNTGTGTGTGTGTSSGVATLDMNWKANNGTPTLTAFFSPGAGEAGQTASFWIVADVQLAVGGGGAKTAFFYLDSNGGWAPLAAFGLTSDNARLTGTTFSSAGVQIPVLDGTIQETVLAGMKARVYGAYRIGSAPVRLYPAPIFDCSVGGRCWPNSQ